MIGFIRFIPFCLCWPESVQKWEISWFSYEIEIRWEEILQWDQIKEPWLMSAKSYFFIPSLQIFDRSNKSTQSLVSIVSFKSNIWDWKDGEVRIKFGESGPTGSRLLLPKGQQSQISLGSLSCLWVKPFASIYLNAGIISMDIPRISGSVPVEHCFSGLSIFLKVWDHRWRCWYCGNTLALSGLISLLQNPLPFKFILLD